MGLPTRVRHLIKRGGLGELFRGMFRFVYWQSGLRRARYTLDYRLYGSPVTCTVAGTTTQFKTSSPKEQARVRTLHGERTVVADLIRGLDHDDVIYDIGANVGTYACFVAQQVDSGSMIAFEPHPANVDRLRENAELNGIDVHVRSVALSNEAGSTKLTVSGTQNAAGIGTHSLSAEAEEDTINVETVEGDRLIATGEVPPPSIIKIDVEGAEQHVLEGLTSALENERCHTVYCEVHPERLPMFGGSVEQVETLLEDAGYSITVIEDRSPEYFLKAVRET